MSEVIQHPGGSIRKDIEELKLHLEAMNSRLYQLEELNKQHISLVYELARSHNSSITTTQKIVKELSMGIKALFRRTDTISKQLEDPFRERK